MAPESHLRAALCFPIPEGWTGDGKPAEWIELIPAGPNILGRDGRSWVVDDPAAVVSATNRHQEHLPVDWEHSTYKRGRHGEEAPAAGWIEDLRVQDGRIQGRIQWTVRGLNSITQREYRYLSPTFDFDYKTRTIFRLTSAALTNVPNLRLPALNRSEEETNMSRQNEQIAQALRLGSDATVEQAVARIKEIQSDLQTALNQALEAGKITPATVEYHRAQCQAEGGLERFKAYVEQAPVIAGKSGLDGRQPETAHNRTENDDAAKIRRMFGHSEEDLKKVDQARK